MQREVVMTAQDFLYINSMLLQHAEVKLYGVYDRHEVIRELDLGEFDISYSSNYLLLIGKECDSMSIIGKRALENFRKDKMGFVNVRFGGEDADAIGTTCYLSDPSGTEKIISRELDKILKLHAHRGMQDIQSGDILEKVWWTDAARTSRKNLGCFRYGDYTFKNKLPCLRPRLDSIS